MSRKSTINVIERVKVIGTSKAKGLIDFHNFSGAGWDGKYVGISKETWMTAYLSISDEDNIICTFQQLGTFPLLITDFSGCLPANVSPLERFLCSLYAPDTCPIRKVPDLRWMLFRTKNIEGEKLPPTLPTLFLHILRCNFISLRNKSYTNAHLSTCPLVTCHRVRLGGS